MTNPTLLLETFLKINPQAKHKIKMLELILNGVSPTEAAANRDLLGLGNIAKGTIASQMSRIKSQLKVLNEIESK